MEWKKSLSEIKDIIKTVSVFSNTEGGRMLIGLSETGTVAGVEIGKGTIENITNLISQHTEPKIHPRIIVKTTGGKDIIIIDVTKSHDSPVLADGISYIRVGKSSMKMSKHGEKL
ncbi:MAG: RNA-binding domain-containing protein [Candidatus Omnitrophota bacterium]